MYPEFNGRTVLVTGGSRGIGAATAAAFAAEGARVWVAGRDRQALDDTVAGIEKDGGTAFAAVADVTSLTALEAVRDQVGPVDVLAAFAGGGIARPGPTAAMTEQEWHSVVDGNLTATFLTLRTFLPAMQERRSGSIITMASTAGRQPSNLPGPWGHQWGAPVAYAAAKAGIIMLTKHVAAEVAVTTCASTVSRPPASGSNAWRRSPWRCRRRLPRTTRWPVSASPRTSRRPACSWPPTAPHGSPA